jgi:DinB family protein
VDYTTLTLEEVRAELDRVMPDVRTTFGSLDARQFNWRPDATSWSVAQCFDHLVSTNRAVCQAIARADDAAAPRTIWQRLPMLPALFGRLLVSTQGPVVTRKFTAPKPATPSHSEIGADVLDRFAASHQAAVALTSTFAGRDPARLIIVSPFVRFVTYSALNAFRLIAAHERRHIEQARRVVHAAGFPG